MISPRPWRVERDPWMTAYLIVDANGKEVAQVISSTGKRKPGSFQKELDMELSHANAHMICRAINAINE